MSGDSPLHEAARVGDLLRVRELLKSNSSRVNNKNSSGNTALHEIFYGNRLSKNWLQIVRLLLDHGADINAKGNFQQTPLFMAAQYHHETHVAEYLLKNGANANIKDVTGDAALHRAFDLGSKHFEDMVKLLLRYGADTNAIGNSERTPLICAADRNRFEVVKTLVEAGAQVNYVPRNGEGHSALYHACCSANWQIIEYLILKGAQTNVRSRHSRETLLHALAKYSNYWVSSKRIPEKISGVVKLLVERGVDVEARDSERKTALDYAQINNEDSLTRILIDAGATYDFTSELDREGNTVLHRLIRNTTRIRQTEMARLFIDYGAVIEVRNKSGQTPLHVAVQYNNKEIMNLLLAKISGVEEAKLKRGIRVLRFYGLDNANVDSYALSVATILGYEEVVDRLIEARDDVQTYARTPLYYAIETRNLRLVKMFLEAGCRVDRKILTISVKFDERDMELICLLLEYDVDLYEGKELEQCVLVNALQLEIKDIPSRRKLTSLLVCYYAIDVRLNRPTPSYIMSLVESNEYLSKLYCLANRKLSELKEHAITGNMSMYDVISRKLDPLVKFLGDKENHEAVANLAITGDETLKVHECIIKTRTDLALEKRRLLDRAREIFDEIFVLPSLPEEIVWKILGCLNVRQLRRMVEAK